jgi:hypothetical protein
MGVSETTCLGCPQTLILPISASQEAKIVCMSHQCLAQQDFFSLFLFFGGTGVWTQDLMFTKQAVYHLSYTSSPTTIFKYLHHLWRHCKTTWVEWTDSAPIPSPCSKNQTTGFFNGQSTLKCSAVVPVTLDHVGKGHIFVYFSPAVPSCILWQYDEGSLGCGCLKMN